MYTMQYNAIIYEKYKIFNIQYNTLHTWISSLFFQFFVSSRILLLEHAVQINRLHRRNVLIIETRRDRLHLLLVLLEHVEGVLPCEIRLALLHSSHHSRTAQRSDHESTHLMASVLVYAL